MRSLGVFVPLELVGLPLGYTKVSMSEARRLRKAAQERAQIIIANAMVEGAERARVKRLSREEALVAQARAHFANALPLAGAES